MIDLNPPLLWRIFKKAIIMKIYFIMAIGALVMGAYFYGANIADAKCQMQHLKNNVQNQEILIQNKKEIHEKVYKTGVADIRGILLDKYTIKE